MGASFKFSVYNYSSFWMNLSVDSNNWNCVDTEFCVPSFIGASIDMGPGAERDWTLYHKTGHGCDGTQAVFQASPKFSLPDGGTGVVVPGAPQGFQFDNNGAAAFNSPTGGTTYYSVLTQSGPGQAALWTISPVQCYVTIVNNYTQPLTTGGAQPATIPPGKSWQQWAGDLAIAVPGQGVILLEDLGNKFPANNDTPSRGLRFSNSIDGDSSVCWYKGVARPTITVDASGHISYSGVELTRPTPPPIEISLDTVRKFAPEIHFHEFEPFFPCSIDFLLKGATISDSTKVVALLPASDDLARLWSGDHHVEIALSQTPGQFVRGVDNTINIAAPMYFAVQRYSDLSIAITYLIICAHNGSQTVCFIPYTSESRFWCILNDYARHPGDLERVTVHLVPKEGDYEIDKVTFEADGNPTDYQKADVALNGTHVTVHSALNSHGTWNLLKEYPWNVQGSAACVEVGAALAGCETHSDTEGSTTGIVWKPTDFRFLGLDGTGQPIGTETWAKFAGRIGGHTDNGLRDGRYLDYNGNRDAQRGLIDDKRSMNDVDWAQVSIVNAVAELIGKIESGFRSGDGPLGPATRDYVVNRNPKK
jgi:hypothetical protein